MSPAQDYGQSVEINCMTGEVTARPLTNAEVAQRDTAIAAAQVARDAQAAKEAARQTRRARLQTVIDGGSLDQTTEDILRELLGE